MINRSHALIEKTKARLLLVDDEELNLDMLSRRLERVGFLVEVASNGRDALRLISERSFDLVLLDQMMPGMSGAEVLETLRADAISQTLPVIMVTAVAESDRISQALESGANDYITKPVDFTVAVARIRAQLVRRSYEMAIRQSEERYALAARASRDGLWDWDLRNDLVYFSPRWKEMLGVKDEIMDTPDAWFSRIVGADRLAVRNIVEKYLQGKEEVLQCDYRMRHSDGSWRWMACRAIATRNDDGFPYRLAGSQSDVTEEKTRDILTGLPNRLRLISYLESVMEESDGNSEQSSVSSPDRYAVLFLDLDSFKVINDSFGHVAGDHLLKCIANRLQLAVDTTMTKGSGHPALVARMGGDEFAILLQQNGTKDVVETLAAEVLMRMREPFELFERTVHCIFSVGATLQHTSHRVPEDVLREADIAMYNAKAHKHGELVIFHQTMLDKDTEQHELELDIRSAIGAGEFFVVYQPKVDLATETTYGVEALVRWNHPLRGVLSPALFIPIAEKTGVISALGRWILQESCRQVRTWHDLFVSTPPLELSVNLSPCEFKQSTLVSDIEQTLLETGFPAKSLHLEITEGVLFEDINAARATLCALKGIGVVLDIDDFGTGYSSLKYMRELPFDNLKIDQYFIRSLDPNRPSSAEMVRTILSMANNLGLQVVAEGIETEVHRNTLKDLGCRFGQGYYFSRPVSAVAIENLLSAQRLETSTSAASSPSRQSDPQRLVEAA